MSFYVKRWLLFIAFAHVDISGGELVTILDNIIFLIYKFYAGNRMD